MKTIALTTALTLALAAPALASDQLAASLGVDAGEYTVAELVQLRHAQDSDDTIVAAYVAGGSVMNVTDAAAVTAFTVQSFEEDNDVIRANFLRNGGSEVVSTSGATPDHVAIAMALLPRDNEDE